LTSQCKPTEGELAVKKMKVDEEAKEKSEVAAPVNSDQKVVKTEEAIDQKSDKKSAKSFCEAEPLV